MWTDSKLMGYGTPQEPIGAETDLDVLLGPDPAGLVEFRLLRYIDPFGNTVFSRWQMADLLEDLDRLELSLGLERRPRQDREKMEQTLQQIRTLAERCRSEDLTYLVLIGD